MAVVWGRHGSEAGGASESLPRWADCHGGQGARKDPTSWAAPGCAPARPWTARLPTVVRALPGAAWPRHPTAAPSEPCPGDGAADIAGTPHHSGTASFFSADSCAPGRYPL